MANTIKINGKTISYTVSSVNTSTITFSDGQKLTISGSAANAAILAAYKALLAAVPPVATPPVAPAPPIAVINDPLPIIHYGPEIIGKQMMFGAVKDKRLVFAPGVYPSQYLNFNSVDNVKIEMTGVQMPDSRIDIGVAQKLEMFGASMYDQKYRCIVIGGLSNDVNLHHMSFENIGDYSIKNDNQAYWTGKAEQACKNWVFDNLSFINTSTCFDSGSSFEDKGVKNLMQNFTLSNSVFKDSDDIGNSISIGACDGYNVLGNKLSNINTKNNNDNGWCKIVGTGNCYSNQISNHEGYLIRAWLMSFAGRKAVKMYNNIGFNSTKYGLLEVQTTPEMKAFIDKYPALASVADAEVYGNVAANMGTSKDWCAPVLVVYNTYGKVNFHDNLGVSLTNDTQDVSKLWYGMNDPALTSVSTSGNVYYKTASEAVKANSTLKTLLAL